MQAHDRTGKPVEPNRSRTHTVQEQWLLLKNIVTLHHSTRDNKFNLAIDEENIDFNILRRADILRWWNDHMALTFTTWFSRSRITLNDMHFKVIFNNLEQFNPFSAESQGVQLKLLETLNYARLVDVEPKSQCRACLTYWNVGIVYCTVWTPVAKMIRTENKKCIKSEKYIKLFLDLFSIPELLHQEGPATRSQIREERRGCTRIPHRQINFKKKVSRRERILDNIHDRFIRDARFFRKTMIELGRSEEVILEMDRLGEAKITAILPRFEEEIAMSIVATGGSVRKFGEFRHDARQGIDRTSKKALSTLRTASRNQEDQCALWKLVAQLFLLMVAIGTHSWWDPSLWDIHHKDGVNTDRTVKPVVISESSIYLWYESQQLIWCTICQWLYR